MKKLWKSSTRFSGMALLAYAGLGLFGSIPAQAAKFANQFVEFELPPQWQCTLEGAEWVCQSVQDAKKREAIIVLAAKLKGDQDSLEQYMTYLKAPKNFTSVQGKPIKSDPKYARNNIVMAQPWVDSLHFESELPGYYTRYLATIKNDIGVLVTYSIQKDKYAQYQQEFENMVKTLRVFRKAGGINAGPQTGNLFNNIAVPQDVSVGTVFPTGDTTAAPAPKRKQDDNTLLIVVGLAVVGFIWWKKRRSDS